MPKATPENKPTTGSSSAKRWCSCSRCRGTVKQLPRQIRHHLERDMRNASYAPARDNLHASVSNASSRSRSRSVGLVDDPSKRAGTAHTAVMSAGLRTVHTHNSSASGSSLGLDFARPDISPDTDVPMIDAAARDTTHDFQFDTWTPPNLPSPAPAPPLIPPSMSLTIPATPPQQTQPLSHAREIAVDLAPLESFIPSPLAQQPPTASSSRGAWLQDAQSEPVSLAAVDVVAALDHVEHRNAVAAANAVQLTAHAAHADPLTKPERRVTRLLARMLADAQRALEEPAASSAEPATSAEPDRDEYADVDEGFEEPDEEEEGETDTRSHPTSMRVPRPWEDDRPLSTDVAVPPEDIPDPFYSGPYSNDENSDMESVSSLHDVLLSIQVMVSWLSSRHNLPRVACNVMLWFFGTLLVVLGFDVLAQGCPRTLATVYRRLGTDPPIVLLPTCPGCQTVYPRTPTLTACPSCNIELYRNLKSNNKIPVRKYPTHALEPQLRTLLARPGMSQLLDGWRTLPRSPDALHDIFDGKIAQNLKAPDNSLFFRNTKEDQHGGPGGELRIGVTLGLDWFSHLVSNIAPSHSSCPVSFNIANLPTHLRFHVTNLILVAVLPGPREQTCDEIQGFLRWIVSELLRLWKDGIVVDGRIVRVIFIAVICDKPAAHKVGGFGPVSHTFFCHCCWIMKDDLVTLDAFRTGAFQPRTDQRHRQLGERYKALRTSKDREKFVKSFSTRYRELSRLPYFDTVRQIVIDPMHNLALGLVKTQFYTIWVKNKILRDEHLMIFHQLMTQCDVPDHLGRLPTQIGMPAGGSLTADQWIILATVMGPLIMPVVWDGYLDSDSDRVAAVARFEQKKIAAKLEQAQSRKIRDAERRQEAKARKASGADDATPGAAQKRKRITQPKITPEDKYSMHEDDVPHFLKLSRALHLLLQHQIPLSSLPDADSLLRTYCTEIGRLYGTSEYKPNHHYATHTVQFIHDFGPLCGFWTFLFERLNRVLKSFNTNKHANGDLEETFLREYSRLATHQHVLDLMLALPPETLAHHTASKLTAAQTEDRGTVAELGQLAVDIREAHLGSGALYFSRRRWFARVCLNRQSGTSAIYSLSSDFSTRSLDMTLHAQVVRQLRKIYPDRRFHSLTEFDTQPGSSLGSTVATFFRYITWKGKRFAASNASGSRKRSMACVFQPTSEREDSPVTPRIVEILDILQIQQSLGQNRDITHTWLHVWWLMPFTDESAELELPSAWRDFPHIQVWQEDVYDKMLPEFIDPARLSHHVGCLSFEFGKSSKALASVGLLK